MLTKSVLPSGVSVMPVTLHSFGPSRNRRRFFSVKLSPTNVLID